MRRPVVRRVRGVLFLAIAVLAWAVASQSGVGGPGGSIAVPERAASIESLTMLLVVTADRPTVSIAHKRMEGPRVPWAAPTGRSNLHVPLGLLHPPWPATPTGRSGPLVMHFGGRGPPLALAA